MTVIELDEAREARMTRETDPPPPGGPLDSSPKMKLSNEDRLSIENLYLKVENMRLQQKILEADVLRSVEMKRSMQREMQELQTALSRKYGVNLLYCHVAPDGTLTPKETK